MQLHDVGLFQTRSLAYGPSSWRPRRFDPCLDCWQQGRIRVPDRAFDPASFLADAGSAGLDVALLRAPGSPGCPHGGAS